MAVKLGNGKWAVKENNLLAYNDNSGQFFNKEFDFTRGSSATYVGKDGLIKTAGLQDTNLVQNGDFSELGSELITNGDFEDGENNWSFGGDWTLVNGTAEIQTAAVSYLIQSNIIPLTVKKYKLQYEVVTTNGNNLRLAGGSSAFGTVTLDSATVGVKTVYLTSNGTNPNLQFNQNSFRGSIDNVSVKQVDPNDEWTLGSGWSYGDGVANALNTTLAISQNTFISSSTNYRITYNISNYSSGNVQIRVGDINTKTQLRSSNGTFSENIISGIGSIFSIDALNAFTGSISNISVQEIQVNTPRIDFSDSADGALLLEPQRTNLVSYSEDFSNGTWSKTGLTVSSNQIISPDGSLNADEINITSANAHFLFKFISVNASTNYVLTFYAKKGTATDVSYSIYDSTNSADIIASTSYYSQISNTNWTRITVEFTTPFGCTSVRPYPLRDGSSTGTVYIWGAQLEEQSYPTSYIPTQGSTSTRIAETCKNSGSAQDFNSEEGVLYCYLKDYFHSSGNGIGLYDELGNKVYQIYYYGGNYDVYNGSTFIMDRSTIYPVESKIAVRWTSTAVTIFINGVNATKNGASLSANTPEVMNMAVNTNGYSKTKNIQVFTKALSDEELQKLTTI